VEAEWLNQMKPAAAIGAEANNVARVGRNFGLKQYNIEHLGVALMLKV
jgi:hypothetical protein